MEESKLFLSRLGFRQNWPVWVTVFTLIFAAIVARIAPDVFKPPVFYPDPQTKYSYAELLSTYSHADGRITILLVVFVCLSLVIIVGFFRKRNQLRFLAIVLAVPASCYACFMMETSAIYVDWTRLEDVQSLSFNDHSYHLTYAQESVEKFGSSYGRYYVFECNEDNLECSVLNESNSRGYIASFGSSERLSAKLLIDASENVLYVLFGVDKVRIAPPDAS